MELFLIIIGVIISLAVLYFVCWFLPKRYNKYVYIVYGLKNPINLRSNFIGFISFAIGFVMISGSFNNEYATGFSIILGIVFICLSVYLCSYIIIKCNIKIQHKILGCILASASMFLVVFEIFSLIDDLKKSKTLLGKTINTGITGLAIYAFRPELSEEEMIRISNKKAQNPNLNYKSLRFI